jgi:hypothetical protein
MLEPAETVDLHGRDQANDNQHRQQQQPRRRPGRTRLINVGLSVGRKRETRNKIIRKGLAFLGKQSGTLVSFRL